MVNSNDINIPGFIDSLVPRSEEDSGSPPISELLPTFSVKKRNLCLYMLTHPDEQISDSCRAVQYAPESMYTARSRDKAFAYVMDTIREKGRSLIVEWARYHLRSQAPAIAEKMAARALGDGVAAQRAGERILESVGVLGSPTGDTGIDTIDLIALRLRRTRGKT